MAGSSKTNKKNGTTGSLGSAAQKTLFSYFKQAPVPAERTTPTPTEKPVTESLAVREPESKEEDAMDIDNESQNASDNVKEEVSLQGRPRKRANYVESEDDHEDSPLPSSTPGKNEQTRKRRQKKRIIDEDDEDDEDDEYVPAAIGNDSDHDEDTYVPEHFDDMDEDEIKSPVKLHKSPAAVTPLRERFQSISMSPSLKRPSSKSSQMLANLSTSEAQKKERTQKFKEKNDVRYSWLAEQKDANGNPVGSPEYDPRTLYIPKQAWNNFTPFERQYWEVKSKQWDTLVFFKKGKFYELYEKDADIGHQIFDLKMTDRVNMRMVGVPEMSFDYWAAQFIAKGHKVARVDQMETAIGKTMREKTEQSKADKIIRRELTSVLTAGTLVDAGLLTDDMSTYCMSIKEYCPAENLPPTFGICFVDTATAEFNVVTFEDDVNRTKFETLIMQIKPRELVTEKNRLSQSTRRILKNTLDSPIWNMLMPDIEFWDARTTADEIRIAGYFNSNLDNDDSWPQAFKAALEKPILMSAVGGLLWYLRSLKLDKELVSARNIHAYDPIRNASSLVLDGQTLANLEIFQNSYDGSTEGTLFKLIGNSVTPFGKRLFKRWLCHPLRRAVDINARLDAIEDLMRMVDLHEELTNHLAGMPDLERLISRIHSGRCKVKEFLTTLEGFRKTQQIISCLRSYADNLTSALLQNLVESFPNIDERVEFFSQAFITAEVDIDYQKMISIIPKKGVNKEWDALNKQIKDLEVEFDRYLLQLKKDLRCAKLVFKDLGKEIYQVEVPKGVKVPQDWIQLSATSKVNRYWNSKIKGMVTQYKELLETKNAFIKNFTSEVYADFDQHYVMWLNAVQHIAQVDALVGLAKGSMNLGEPACRPQVLEQEESVMEFEELRHPCVVPGVATDFIPNDTRLGGQEPSIIVLTGPNMGGKSTLLRQTCVAIIMAQLGCYVPARSCRLTPCDRIYTRIGANDNIMAGQSTFMVELAETSKILHEATPRSMVILDELGRGTSTFDGYAIAYAVLHYLATHVGCLAMFSTHYQTLCREFERNPEINNMHM
ncbi:muts domain V-domain-containing protein [Radiomyces spectabilis]|uniref:muts domain V-domain-containing protein n=1 Tax=Radiomyces spectabilis TaxID=64574 RepID=UPI002220ECA6|nr:muts domain V-domain-containing protein [Radiomyces spectabilis]KAI8377990.1 muts domain V-domain-containing protein [Radiomyces spectabilis]